MEMGKELRTTPNQKKTGKHSKFEKGLYEYSGFQKRLRNIQEVDKGQEIIWNSKKKFWKYSGM